MGQSRCPSKTDAVKRVAVDGLQSVGARLTYLAVRSSIRANLSISQVQVAFVMAREEAGAGVAALGVYSLIKPTPSRVVPAGWQFNPNPTQWRSK